MYPARWFRLLAVIVLAACGLLMSASPASAHPLGNFTTNRYARVEVGASIVRVHYVLDEAELVAFREREEIESRGEEAFATGRSDEILRSLRLEVQGSMVELRAVDHRLTSPAGQGGLTTLRLEILFEGLIPPGARSGASLEATFSDGNQPDRIGWREILVLGVGGTRLLVVHRSDGRPKRHLAALPDGSGIEAARRAVRVLPLRSGHRPGRRPRPRPEGRERCDG